MDSIPVILLFLWNDLRAELALDSQRAAQLFTHYFVLWNITTICLHFKIQQILTEVSPDECTQQDV